jgi:hypothetical protein
VVHISLEHFPGGYKQYWNKTCCVNMNSTGVAVIPTEILVQNNLLIASKNLRQIYAFHQ